MGWFGWQNTAFWLKIYGWNKWAILLSKNAIFNDYSALSVIHVFSIFWQVLV